MVDEVKPRFYEGQPEGRSHEGVTSKNRGFHDIEHQVDLGSFQSTEVLDLSV